VDKLCLLQHKQCFAYAADHFICAGRGGASSAKQAMHIIKAKVKESNEKMDTGRAP